MVSLVMLAAGVGVALALAFVLAPLVREEGDLKPFRRARPGMRHLHGLESVEVDLPDERERYCPHCGAVVEAEFTYCGKCCSPLP